MSVSAALRAIVLPVSTSPVSETSRTSGMLDEPLADRDAVAGHDLQHAGRDDLLRELDEAQQRQRRLLGRLEDLDVAGGERRPHLPDRHHQRVVPRADAADDPDRLAPDHRRVALDVLAGRLALEVAGGAGEEAEVVGRERHLVARRHERLADVAATRAARAPRRCSSITSASLCRSSERSFGVFVEPRRAAPSCAASTARSTSSAPQRGTSAIVSPVAGLITSIVSPEAASTHSPPTKIL